MSTTPTQAVILAGGRGARMRPLSDARPKPMIELAGKPILAHVLDDLKRNGLTRVLILLGYKGDVIRRYFGDGHALGLDITYAQEPETYDTGARLRAAKALIDPFFLLLYADNVWPLPLETMAQAYARAKAPAMLTAYRNDDDYSRPNIVVKGSFATLYDKTRQAKGLTHVDIGFMFLRKEVLEEIPEGNVNFEAALYPKLAREGRLAVFETRHRYYSLTAPERLARVEAYLTKKKTVFIDRDGVLNKKPPKADYVKTWEDFAWLEGAKEALALFRQNGYRVILISNQAGIARGVMSEEALETLHARLHQEVEAAGGYIDAIYYCPHGWDADCACRKPKPGMLFQAQKDFCLNLSQITFFGDDERDGEAARAAGCRFVLIKDDKNLLAAARILLLESVTETLSMTESFHEIRSLAS